MAHPCIYCGGECYCHGDIDDAVVSKTPNNCEGCGCETDEGDDDSFEIDDELWDEFTNNYSPADEKKSVLDQGLPNRFNPDAQ